jgi:hypothetical protein
MEYRLGKKLIVINAGEFPEALAPMVHEAKRRLLTKRNTEKMASFLVNYTTGANGAIKVKETWVAISGIGNLDKTNNGIQALKDLPNVHFVPFLEKKLDDISHPTDPVLDFYGEYLDRKALFRRFMIFVSNAVSLNTDGAYDTNIIDNTFHLTPKLVAYVRNIKKFLNNPLLKQQHQAFLNDPSRKAGHKHCEIPLNFFTRMAWECYPDDMVYELTAKIVFPLQGNSTVIRETSTNRIIYNPNYYEEKAYIARLGFKKDDALYHAFNELWKHTLRFTREALSKKMQHCAETNLIAYIKSEKAKGNDPLKRSGKFYLFSTVLSAPRNTVEPLCDNCTQRSLPDIFELNVEAGDHRVRFMNARIPITPISKEMADAAMQARRVLTAAPADRKTVEQEAFLAADELGCALAFYPLMQSIENLSNSPVFASS